MIKFSQIEVIPFFFLILVYIIFISVNEIKVSLLEVVNLLSE